MGRPFQSWGELILITVILYYLFNQLFAIQQHKLSIFLLLFSSKFCDGNKMNRIDKFLNFE